VSYVKKVEKRFYEYKLIEIINEREVKEHFNFIYPYYIQPNPVNNKQHIFFSADLEYMNE